ncbi:MAG: hypothetical protein K0R65_2580 [Crocinitomicaceae bacterium]|jgi:sterol desaturase/sphingolipid hydroxylase (fatty acid hydroxylase superfamily)|nr:hypothetical protein [Crocinitomicaceae bacterium]
MILLILQDKQEHVPDTQTKKKGMYQNPVLELLSVSGPKMMITFHIILASTVIYAGYQLAEAPSVLKITSFFIAGFFSWSLAEYVMHRYVFHFEGQNKLVRAVHYAMHGYHHEVPHDDKHMFMPPVPALLILSLFFGFFYLFLGGNTWFFLPGFEIGYLTYSLIHYRIHRGVPKNRFLNKLWLHHANHHYKDHDKSFGVSSLFWDRVFGTLPDERQDAA